MTRIEIVNPADWIPRIGALLAENWAETGFDFPFEPDVDTYRSLHDSGMLFALAALHEGEPVGYCTVAIVPHAHNPSILLASNDALFVAPAYRNGLLPGRLIKAAEAEAKARGASKFSWHCRAGTSMAETLVRHGYEPVDVVVVKGL